MNKLIDRFLAQHTISAHSFVAAYAIFTTYLAMDPTARGIVFGFLNRHPFCYLAFGFANVAYARYAGSHSTEGQIAELGAKNISTVADLSSSKP